jgi:hypothetical protein
MTCETGLISFRQDACHLAHFGQQVLRQVHLIVSSFHVGYDQLTISDSNDKQWLLQLPLSSRTKQERLKDLLIERSTKRSQTCDVS